MKRTLAALFFLLALNGTAWADKAAEIADLENQLQAELAKAVPLAQQLKVVEADKHTLLSAGAAYAKDVDALQNEMQPLINQRTDLERQYKLLQPAIDNYNQRVQEHNRHVCTERCVNGKCDGSCAWYNREKESLDHQKAEIENARKPLDAQGNTLAQQVQQQFGARILELKDRQEKFQAQYADVLKREEQIKDEFMPIYGRIQDLQRQIAILKGDTASCLKAIPKECDAPNTPALVTKCEQMHAQCGKMFDGN